MAKKVRLDQLLVERGLFETRSKAQGAIMAGEVFVDGEKHTKAGAATPMEARIEVTKASRFVSRGGLKLESALAHFPIKPEGRVCLDLGSSTGGFTDCLLQKGAAKVYAVDVGTAQLDSKLKADPRVVSRENTHAKFLKPEQFDPRPDLCVIDCSFISVTQVLPFAAACLKPSFDLLALVKPQFEVGPKLAPKGVVREQSARDAAIERVRQSLTDLKEEGLFECPVHGPKGNIEYFLWLRPRH